MRNAFLYASAVYMHFARVSVCLFICHMHVKFIKTAEHNNSLSLSYISKKTKSTDTVDPYDAVVIALQNGNIVNHILL